MLGGDVPDVWQHEDQSFLKDFIRWCVVEEKLIIYARISTLQLFLDTEPCSCMFGVEFNARH